MTSFAFHLKKNIETDHLTLLKLLFMKTTLIEIGMKWFDCAWSSW